MDVVYFLMFGSWFAGLALLIVWWLVWGRKARLLVGAVSGFTLAAGLLAVLSATAVWLMSMFPVLIIDTQPALWNWCDDYRFAIPLILGVITVVLLTFPVQSRRGRGTAELIRRTPASFIRARWLVAPGVLLALIVVISVITGAASQPDWRTGRYAMYWVDLGGDRGMGTTIYGWFYSVPALILIGVLIVIAIVSLSFVSRPALAQDRDRDIRVRTIRTRNIITAVTGALLLHLGLIFGSLAATASPYTQFPFEGDNVKVETTFAALVPALSVASPLCVALGIAFWITIALSAIPSRRGVPNAAQS